jgi:hypothetical protein
METIALQQLHKWDQQQNNAIFGSAIEAMRPITEPVASVTYTSLYFSEIFILR